MRRSPMALCGLVLPLLASFQPAVAQTLGTYRWQTQPYCNVLTLSITQQGSVYALDGTDDRCGATMAASARGMAFLNQDGTIGFGIAMVHPGGTPVHLEATINAATLGGTWRDSSGGSGSFVLILGGVAGGTARPVSASGVPPGSIMSAQLANGAVGSSTIAPNAVTGAHIANQSITVADLLDAPRMASSPAVPGGQFLTSSPVIVKEVTLSAPAAGQVIVHASGFVQLPSTGLKFVRCTITPGPLPTSVERPFLVDAAKTGSNESLEMPFGASQVFSVPPGSTTFRLVCFGSEAYVFDVGMTALYLPGS